MDIIIEKAKQGDMAAFEQLVLKYQSVIYNTALKICSNPDDAYDISQEALLKIYNNIQYFEGKSKFSTWIYRIVTNTALDYIKKYRKSNVFSLNAQMDDEGDSYIENIRDDSPTPEEVIDSEETKKLVHQALDKLSPDHKAILVLRDINGLSYEEIAEVLMLSTGTVKSRINRARNALYEIISKNKELF
ncbi:MAG: sigma-70 family RNA polymerase sigma factor [Clostridia bacterium]|nr:sigma-70 family RNA polymerase sigma factor [Clostridia bacterium]